MTPPPAQPAGDIDVVLLGFDPAFRDPAKRSNAERLRVAFGIDAALARHFVDNAPVVVKHQATPEIARRYEQLLRSIGAYVDLRGPALARSSEGPGQSRPAWGSTPSTTEAAARGSDDPFAFASDAILPSHAAPAAAPAADPFNGQSALDFDGELRLADEEMPAPPPPPPSSPHLARCPRCSFEQPIGAEECARCGVIFSKAQGGSMVIPALTRPAPAAVPPPRAIPITPVVPVRPLDEDRGPSFWASIPRAFIVPFWGRGVLWQVILMAMLLVTGCVAAVPSCFTLILICVGLFGFFGLIGRYFQASVQRGLDGEVEAPALPWGGDLGDLKGDLILPGTAYALLAMVLMAVPLAATVSSARASLEQQAHLQAEWKLVNQGEVVDSSDEPQLFDMKGASVDLERATGVFDAQTEERQKVRVLTERKHIVYYDAEGVALDEPLDAEPPSPVPPAILLTFLIPLLLWPMCVTVGLIDGSLLSMFNPIKVLPAVFKGGLPYLAVVVMGIVATFGCSFGAQLVAATASLAGPLGALGGSLIGALLAMCSYSYATGVQAWLMGRLGATRPEVFSHLD